MGELWWARSEGQSGVRPRRGLGRPPTKARLFVTKAPWGTPRNLDFLTKIRALVAEFEPLGANVGADIRATVPLDLAARSPATPLLSRWSKNMDMNSAGGAVAQNSAGIGFTKLRSGGPRELSRVGPESSKAPDPHSNWQKPANEWVPTHVLKSSVEQS